LVAAGVGLFSLRPAVRHTLWLLVLLKLVTPPLISLPVVCPPALEAVFARVHSASAVPLAVERSEPQQVTELDWANGIDDELTLDNAVSSPMASETPPDDPASQGPDT